MSPMEILIRGYLAAYGHARTYQLASRCNLSTPTMRRHLQRLEVRGVVARSERYSAVNDISWTLATKAEGSL